MPHQRKVDVDDLRMRVRAAIDRCVKAVFRRVVARVEGTAFERLVVLAVADRGADKRVRCGAFFDDCGRGASLWCDLFGELRDEVGRRHWLRESLVFDTQLENRGDRRNVERPRVGEMIRLGVGR